jgi:diguanylate cyclase (GGDEF)-like protein
VLRRHARGTDLAGRLGGDELALLLPRTHPDDVRSVADRLARALVREGILVSIGLAVIPGNEGDGRSLVEQADLALLNAKRRGKRRVERAA